jgi:hypothetical protein
MPSTFFVKLLFESPDRAIIEIKLSEKLIAGGADEESQWLYLEKMSGAMIKLWLNSRDSSLAVEERYFEQGYLKFNKLKATYIEKFNAAQYTLDRQVVTSISEDLAGNIESYLLYLGREIS